MNLAQFAALQLAVVGVVVIVAGEVYGTTKLFGYGWFLMIAGFILSVMDEVGGEDES